MNRTTGIGNPENAHSFSFAEIQQAAQQMDPTALDGPRDAWTTIAATVSRAGERFLDLVRQAVGEHWEGAAATGALRGVREYTDQLDALATALGAQVAPLNAAAAATTRFKAAIPGPSEESERSSAACNSREEQARADMHTHYIGPFGEVALSIPPLPGPQLGAASTTASSPGSTAAHTAGSGLPGTGLVGDRSAAAGDADAESGPSTTSGNGSGILAALGAQQHSDQTQLHGASATRHSDAEGRASTGHTTRFDASRDVAEQGDAEPSDAEPSDAEPADTANRDTSHGADSSNGDDAGRTAHRGSDVRASDAENSDQATPEHHPSTESTSESPGGDRSDRPEINAISAPESTAPQSVSSPLTATTTAPGPALPQSVPAQVIPAPAPMPSVVSAQPPYSPDPANTPHSAGSAGPQPGNQPGGTAVPGTEPQPSTGRSAPPGNSAGAQTGAPAPTVSRPSSPGYTGAVAPAIPLQDNDKRKKGAKFLRTEEHARELLGEVRPTVPPVIGEQ